MMKRRHFLRASLTAAIGLPFYAWRIEPHWLEVVRRDMPVRGLPDRLAGRVLVQISDLHAGPVVAEDYLVAAMQRVSALGADVLVITGDFMTCEGPEQLDAVRRVLRHLTPGRLATVAVLGNHDYGHGCRQVKVADELTCRLQDQGIRVLRNEAVEVAGLTIAGLDDLWGPFFAPQRVLSGVDPDALLLCHNPDGIDRLGSLAWRGWMLSGHTHGGQVKLPFLRPPILPVHNHRYHAGAIDVGAGRQLYVNRALGYLHRLRFNVRPEITVFRLAQA